MKPITNLSAYEDLFKPEKMPTSCLLCKTGELDELGHIIPKFVMRWLKRASKLNKFYFNNDRDKMVADTPAFRMMCNKCEDKFSTLEKYFTDEIFKKYYRRKTPSPVDDQVYNFAISIAWRLIVSTERLKDTQPQEKVFEAIYSPSESVMRGYLNNETENCHHTVYALPIENLTNNISASLIDDNALKYTIRQGLKAHVICDDRIKMLLSSHIPVIYFKIGCYYFFIVQNNYFAGSDFRISSTKASKTKELYILDYTPDLLGFMEWIMDGRFFEINTKDIRLKNYTHRDAQTVWDLAFGKKRTLSDPE